MGGGSEPATQQTQQTQNTNQTTGPNPTIAPILQGGINSLQNYYNANPTAPSYFPGSTVATPSAQTGDALSALFQRGQNGSPFTPAATGLVNDTLNGKYLDINNNPYFQGALQAGFAPQNRAFNDTILPNLRSQFEGSGRNLGGADMGTAQTALHNLSDSQSNAAATASNNAYGAERGLQQQTLGMLPQFQNMDYQNIGAMQGAGAATDAINQNLIDANVARYNYGSNAQPNYISDFLSRIQAGYPGGTTVGQGTSMGTGTGAPSSNSGAATGGMITSLAGSAAMAAAAFM